MRALILALALLAAGKIWFQDTLYRTATEDALVAAYRAPAAEACTRTASAAQSSHAGGEGDRLDDGSRTPRLGRQPRDSGALLAVRA